MVRFYAKVKRPVTVKFRTSSGKIVKFKAKRLSKRRKLVEF